MQQKEFEISHLGKTFRTSHYLKELTSKECDTIRQDFYTKPEMDKVEKQIKRLRAGKTRTNEVYNYYFYDLMADCRTKSGFSNYTKWSINEFMQSDDLIRFAMSKVRSFPRVYPTKNSDISNIKTVFRLSPSGTATKLPNYPYKSVKEILDKYNVNNNYYDFSCGWGIRLSASLATDVNYFGTDPNTRLVGRLENFADKFKEITDTTSEIDIRCIGSEVFVPEWENKIGLAFSSPPYFDLEEYARTDPSGQSISSNPKYSDWLENYIKPTMLNIKRYLIDDGYLLLNVKNVRNYDLYDDCLKIITACGFALVEELDLKNINRTILAQNAKNADENIMVFRKTDTIIVNAVERIADYLEELEGSDGN